MTPDKILTISYYADLFIKGGIAIGISIVGWHFRSIEEDLGSLKIQMNDKAVRLSVTENTESYLTKQVDRLVEFNQVQNEKLDKILIVASSQRR